MRAAHLAAAGFAVAGFASLGSVADILRTWGLGVFPVAQALTGVGFLLCATSAASAGAARGSGLFTAGALAGGSGAVVLFAEILANDGRLYLLGQAAFALGLAQLAWYALPLAAGKARLSDRGGVLSLSLAVAAVGAALITVLLALEGLPIPGAAYAGITAGLAVAVAGLRGLAASSEPPAASPARGRAGQREPT